MGIMGYLSAPAKRNIILNGKRTSLQLEGYIWQSIDNVSILTKIPRQLLLEEVWRNKGGLAMAPSVRLFLIYFFSNYASLLRTAADQATARTTSGASAAPAMVTAEARPDDEALWRADHESAAYHRALSALSTIALS